MPVATIEEAIDAHLKSGLIESALGDPREIIDAGPIKLSRDAPGRKRDPRRQQFTIYNVDPAEALRAVEKHRGGHWALSVVSRLGDDYEKIKATYKAAGYRINTSFPFFVRDLSVKIPQSKDFAVERITTKEQAEIMRKAVGRKAIADEHLVKGDSVIRFYAVFEKGKPTGWVHSIRTSVKTAWVSGLFVEEAHRGRGIGKAVMGKMLTEDKKYGAENSILLASSDGSKIYRSLGYQEIGLMQIFTPIKR